MKPIIQIWIKESNLEHIHRGNYPSTWWRRDPIKEIIKGDDLTPIISVNVSYDWYIKMRDYEADLEDDAMPF
jgi:hypothetical protein|tara:strand:+ start:603 stop:818 length:216 start_codon:yes stop_codon:yes gene_type:complete